MTHIQVAEPSPIRRPPPPVRSSEPDLRRKPVDGVAFDLAPPPPELETRHPLGHLSAFRKNPLELATRAFRTHGEVSRVRIGNITGYFTFCPKIAQTVLIDRREEFDKQTRGYDTLRIFLGDGLVTSEGDFWRRQRRIAQPAFMRARVLELGRVMARAANDFGDELAQQAAGSARTDLAHDLMRITLRIAGETLFGVDLSDNASSIGRTVTTVLKHHIRIMRSPVPYAYKWPTRQNRECKQAIAEADEVVYGIIRERRALSSPPQDLLQLLLETRDADTGETMNDKQLRDEAITMLLAGHETTANALAWTFALLSRHPDIARKVIAEVDEVLDGGLVTVEHAERLTYTMQVLKESMRLYPPVWAAARRARTNQVLGGYRVPAGSYVAMSPFLIHRNPKYWDNPEGFDPDRFSADAIAARRESDVPKLSYLPFSAGPRKCIGDHFAMLEGVLVLAGVLRRVRPHLAPGYRLDPEPSVTLRPRGGLPMDIEAR